MSKHAKKARKRVRHAAREKAWLDSAKESDGQILKAAVDAFDRTMQNRVIAANGGFLRADRQD